MKTSKIKEVANTNEWKSPTGKTIIYHSLIMENGDKINLGKMKIQEVGWELTYEIIEEGQQEFNKAKAVAPQSFGGGFKGNDNRQESIIRQSSLKASIEYLKGAEASLEEVFEAAEKMIAWVNKAPVQNADNQPIKNDSDDLPF